MRCNVERACRIWSAEFGVANSEGITKIDTRFLDIIDVIYCAISWCKGTLAYVHLSCLERWLNQSCRTYCELCRYYFNAVETPRYRWSEAICKRGMQFGESVYKIKDKYRGDRGQLTIRLIISRSYYPLNSSKTQQDCQTTTHW
ncbi:PREDICTED: uncharacterized protein LOC105146636 [Acromyrmex echinatior]|uniref:uncharacterized protein LOC105146636 n=1 Tax=Acromyrmex echinatior TaxID=103372 RepID=UPI000580F2CB|nr:PREDICTED: uncharacterized protein LOC105146636 [Acromyrmex echinatior]